MRRPALVLVLVEAVGGGVVPTRNEKLGCYADRTDHGRFPDTVAT
jgi:hypothetical protein